MIMVDLQLLGADTLLYITVLTGIGNREVGGRFASTSKQMKYKPNKFFGGRLASGLWKNNNLPSLSSSTR